MATFRVSRRAQADLLAIAKFTEETWDRPQAQAYVRELERCCALLAERPGLGRALATRQESLRMEQGSHVLVYRQTADGILVQRTLHKSMLPERHPL